jgi:hypothetical protein
MICFNNIYSNKCTIWFFIYDKLGLHVSVYQTIIRALQHNTRHNEQEETLLQSNF